MAGTMKGRLVALDRLPDGRGAAALVVDGRLEDLVIDPRPSARPLPGAIYRAIAGRPMKGQGGLIATLPDGETGFLRQARGIAPGQALLVQVAAHAEAGKAPPLRDRVLLRGRYAILSPGAPGVNPARALRDSPARAALVALAEAALAEGPGDCGAILRSAAGEAPEADVAAELAELAALARALAGEAETRAGPELLLEAPDAARLAWCDWAHPAPDAVDEAEGSFARHGIDDMIDALRHATHALSGGASMSVEATRALVAVDVNTGPDTSPAAGLKANIAAARALPSALRLRGLGGQVVVDFAPMPHKDRAVLEQTLGRAFREDAVETVLVGWTKMGLYEMQRRRSRLPLREVWP